MVVKNSDHGLTCTLVLKKRCILCVTSYLLLDGGTDWHGTLGIYRTRPGLLHGVLFHFRSEPRNRKLAVFEKRKSEPEIENIPDKKRIKF